MSTEETCKEEAPECCKEEAQERCTSKEQLLVLPIYNAYRAQGFRNKNDALRLTFLEIQYQVGHALTWPCGD